MTGNGGSSKKEKDQKYIRDFKDINKREGMAFSSPYVP
jgi:hypothetical protein